MHACVHFYLSVFGVRFYTEKISYIGMQPFDTIPTHSAINAAKIHTGQERTLCFRSEIAALGHHADRHSSMLQGLFECSDTSSQTYTEPTSDNFLQLSFITKLI